MAGRVGVHLEVIALGGAAGGLKYPGAQSHDPLVGGSKVGVEDSMSEKRKVILAVRNRERSTCSKSSSS